MYSTLEGLAGAYDPDHHGPFGDHLAEGAYRLVSSRGPGDEELQRSAADTYRGTALTPEGMGMAARNSVGRTLFLLKPDFRLKAVTVPKAAARAWARAYRPGQAPPD